MAALSSIIDELTDLVDDLGVLGEERTREFEATHTPTHATHFAVAVKNGAIDIHPVDGDDVVVQAVAKTRHEDDDLDAVTLEFTEEDGLLSLATDVPDDNDGTSIGLDIGLPGSLSLAHVDTKNGKTEVRDVAGDALIETKNGKITVDALEGVLDADAKNGKIRTTDTVVGTITTKNGKVDLDLPAIPDAVTTETKNGKILISVPADTDADFALATKVGAASVEGLTCLVEEESRNAVRGELGAGGPLIDAHTKTGKITLRAR